MVLLEDETFEPEEVEEYYYRNFMWLTDGRLIEVGMTLDSMRAAYEHELGNSFKVVVSKHIKKPIKPVHILVDLGVVEIFETKDGEC